MADVSLQGENRNGNDRKHSPIWAVGLLFEMCLFPYHILLALHPVKDDRKQTPEHFALKEFRAHCGEVQMILSNFFLGYLTGIYREFGDDLSLVIVLKEIAHHNTAPFFAGGRVDGASLADLTRDPAKWGKMEGCNAFSLSQATGIPRETVRRKVKELAAKGWIDDRKGDGLFITQKCGEYFASEFSVERLDELLGASKELQKLVSP